MTVHDRALVEAIDPRTLRVVRRANIGFSSNGIAVGEGSVWVSDYINSTVLKIDPTLGTSTPIDVGPVQTEPGGPAAIAVGFGSVWLSDPLYGLVYRIDPATNKIVATILIGDRSTDYGGGIGEAGGSIWVTNSGSSNTVVRIDPATNSVLETIQLPFRPDGLAVGDGSVWVTLTGAI